jgi:RNA polymerase sigma factor (TIGR02999 family)
MTDVTLILSKIEAGDRNASEELLPIVYDALRKLAGARMANERPDHTLQPTALVHEAYVRLVDVHQDQHWDTRRYFFAAAAEAMRRILVNHARDRNRLKRGGDQKRVELDADIFSLDAERYDIVALSEALDRLTSEDPRSGEIVKLRFFTGLSSGEAAEMLGISRRTVERHWVFARAWLFRELRGTE